MAHDPRTKITAALVGLTRDEIAIRDALHDPPPALGDHPRLAAALAEVSETATAHIEWLERRLRELGANGSPAEGPSDTSGSASVLGAPHAVSAALEHLLHLVDRAVISYTRTMPLTFRLHDSWAVADDGTTAHLARQHVQEYTLLSGRLLALLPVVLRDELDLEGTPCRCTCPACGNGVCVCAHTAQQISFEAWSEARPAEGERVLAVPPPRPASPAEAAGIEGGDVLLAARGHRLANRAELQAAIRDTGEGGRLRLRLRRATELHEVVLRPDALGESARDACLEPGGQDFASQRAESALAAASELSAELARLTTREAQVLRLIAGGASNRTIAARLEITRPTVARHVANILSKLGASNRAEAATIAAEGGLLGPR